MSMQIREFLWPDDFEAVTNLWHASGLYNPTIDGLDNLREVCERNPGLFLLAIEDEKVVGSVIGTFDGRRGYIYHVAVHPDSRRKGYAIAFYRTLGFEVDEHAYSMGKVRPNE